MTVTRELTSRSMCTKTPPGAYRAAVVSAEHSYTRTGRPMYTVTLIVSEGEWRGASITWRLVEVREWPQLLHRYFQGLITLGVSFEDYASATEPQDIIRTIIQAGRTLDVITTLESGGFVNVERARHVL